MQNNINLKKSLGQNFLIDKNIIQKIINSLNVQKNSLIIEVGPGSGALTKELIKLDSFVLCFEIDERLKETLDQINSDNLKIEYKDFLKINLIEYLNDYKYDNLYFIANIPYYITKSIINKVIKEINVDEMVIMVQKEVGKRFMAVPNTKDYSSISVFLQYNFKIEKVADVSRNSFIPIPNVDSVILKFTAIKNKYKIKSEENFYKLIKDSFKHKRKNLKNNLLDYNLNRVEQVLISFKKNLTYRAENLSVEEFVKISNEIN